MEVEGGRQLRVLLCRQHGHQHEEQLINDVGSKFGCETLGPTGGVLRVPAVHGSFVQHASYPERVGEILASEVPAWGVRHGIAECFDEIFEHLSELVEDRFVLGELREPIVGWWLHESLGDHNRGALEHFGGVAHQALHIPTRAVLNGSRETCRAGGSQQRFTLDPQLFDLIHPLFLVGVVPDRLPAGFARYRRSMPDHIPSTPVAGECPFFIDRAVMSQRWSDVTFAHWPVEPDAVRALLPAGLEPDLFNGQAWVSLVGFEMDELRITGFPPIPTTQRFVEFNVRTYVVGPSGPGVWFCSLDVPNWLPVLVARAGFALPYDKGSVAVTRRADQIGWFVQRTWPDRSQAELVVRRTGVTVDATADPLATFLTARWRLYASTRGGLTLTAPVHHEPWPLEQAELLSVDTGVATAAGLPVVGEPILHFASGVNVRVGAPRPVRSTELPTGQLTVHFDDDCGFCSSCVRLLSRVTDQSVRYEPARLLDDPRLATLSEVAIIVTGDGPAAAGVDGVAAVLQRSGSVGSVCAWVLRLPVIHEIAGAVYRWVANHRQMISRRLGLKAACDLPIRHLDSSK